MLSNGPGLCLELGVWLLDCLSVSSDTAKLPRIEEAGRTVLEDERLVLSVSSIRVQSSLRLKARALWLRSFEKLSTQDKCKEKVSRKKSDILIL